MDGELGWELAGMGVCQIGVCRLSQHACRLITLEIAGREHPVLKLPAFSTAKHCGLIRFGEVALSQEVFLLRLRLQRCANLLLRGELRCLIQKVHL